MDNLLNFDKYNPSGIHFSGHIKNMTTMEKELKVNLKKVGYLPKMIKEEVDKGDCLVIEEPETYQAQYLYAEELTGIFSKSCLPLHFVFCQGHTDYAPEIFRKAGALHVVAVKPLPDEIDLEDPVLTYFTKSFYTRIWAQNSQVCVCFE